jgi:predicted acylesterase/phospholipase RssA
MATSSTNDASARFAEPDLGFCDLVMKGGITSGIVYPLAACRLAERYTLRNIGGTSAGAIAAAGAAAAEYGRQTSTADKKNPGFAVLEDLPGWLGQRRWGRTNLSWLFQSQQGTKRAFETILAVLEPRDFKLIWGLSEGLGRFRQGAALGSAVGLLVLIFLSVPLFILAWSAAGLSAAFGVAAISVGIGAVLLLDAIGPRVLVWSITGHTWLTIRLALEARATGRPARVWVIPLAGLATAALVLLPWLLVVAGAIAGAAVRFGRDVYLETRANNFGMCSGGSVGTDHAHPEHAGDEPPPNPLTNEGQPQPLTDWLADLIDHVAGRPSARPLTFGDLWSADGGDATRDADCRVIDLAMITTNLTLGTPYRLPFQWSTFAERESPFFFDPAELRAYFPERIVTWLQNASTVQEPSKKFGSKLYRLPDAEQLPVVVAARLSLTFPVLLSAIPLYAQDGSDFERCWFSDGGISSNFPIHFFDSPLPRWPTFAINLRGPRTKPVVEALTEGLPTLTRDDELVWVLGKYEAPLEESFAEIRNLKDFFFSIKDAMQNWRDNAQQRLPGSRDRVAHIGFLPGEGGLSLEMSKETIEGLGRRGERAGELLGLLFAEGVPNSEVTWERHRWVRYRTATAALEFYFQRLLRGWEDVYCSNRPVHDPQQRYGDLLQQTTPPPFVKWTSDAQRDDAIKHSGHLAKEAGHLRQGTIFSAGAAKPTPTLRLTPSV